MAKPIICLESLSKKFGAFTAVQDVNLEIQDGEFLTLLGPSGCGKTTVLRMIAGYIVPTSGRILLDDKEITDLPPRLRNVGMVFQNYALFPHMTVAENVAFSLRMRGEPGESIRRTVSQMLALVQLTDQEMKRPAQLSGGQQQRVALARALTMSPRILLMDEPMAALDVKLREQMQLELKHIQQELGITTILVTHDQDEALSLSDRVVVMDHGRVVQVDSPHELYRNPVNRYVADFVGKINFLRGVVIDATESAIGIELDSGAIVEARSRERPGRPGQQAWLGVRPERCRLSAPASSGSALNGQVEKIKFVGSDQFAFVRVNAETVFVVRDLEMRARPGESVAVQWEAADAMAFVDE